MKNWVFHAPVRLINGMIAPLCGQVTGHGARGCNQALYARTVPVTCKKCLLALEKLAVQPEEPK